MTPTNLPRWWDITPPHRDIRSNKRLDESIFAADLGQVVRGQAPSDYQDPLRFFASTYLTDGLKSLLGDVLRELSGKGAGNRIIQIETPFGGGKTHTLLTIYHLIQNRAHVIQRPEVQWLLNQVGLKAIPEAQVATIVGTDLSAIDPQVQPDGTKLYTLWGQVAYQLGKGLGREREFYELVRSADEARIAPGADRLRQLLASAPSLILMDELVTYIVPAEGVKADEVKIGSSTTLKDQTITFLQQLTQAVAQTPKSLLLLTIPGSKTELFGQGAQELQQQVFTAANQAADVVGRIQTVRSPVQGDDIYEVLRRRLLEPPANEQARDERQRRARAVAQAYVQFYRSIPNDVPQEVQEEAYIDRITRAYPFHPDVVRILYERWGTLPDFQRTRGALRILGLVLADLYVNNRLEPLILPAHMNLAPGDLRNELVRVLNNTTYTNVLDSDIAGSMAKSTQIDAGVGREHARFRPAERTATTIFLWSHSGATSEAKGATEAQIRVGVLTPEMQPAIVGNVLNELRRKLWYLHEEGSSYRFEARANLNRVIVQKEEGITAPQARKAVEDKITDLVNETGGRARPAGPMFGGSMTLNVRSYLFPKSSQDVADIPSLGVVLLRPGQSAHAGESLSDLPPLVGEVLTRYGERPRENRNTLVVLVPDTALVAEAEKSARRLLALRAAKADSQLALPDNQRKELDQMYDATAAAFPQEVARIYRSVVAPADASKGSMERFDLGLRSFIKGSSLWEDAFDLLAAKDQFLDALAPSLLASNHFGVWPKGADALSTQKLWDAFVQFPHLPILASKDVLAKAIAAGCNQGLLGYAVSDDQGPPFEGDRIRFGEHGKQIGIEIAPTVWVLTAEYARASITTDDMIREIPGSLLIDPAIWPSGSARRRLDDVWAALTTYYTPKKIQGKHVLHAALFDALAKKLLRIAVDGGEPTEDGAALSLARVETLSGVELVRRGGGQPSKPRFISIDVPNVDHTQLARIMTGVITPLRVGQGATVTLRLVIDGDAPQGIDPEVIELTIKETFKQLGLVPEITLSS